MGNCKYGFKFGEYHLCSDNQTHSPLCAPIMTGLKYTPEDKTPFTCRDISLLNGHLKNRQPTSLKKLMKGNEEHKLFMEGEIDDKKIN